MSELMYGMMVFLRVSALLAVFPVFSTANFPVQLRLALGVLLAVLIVPSLPQGMAEPRDVWGWMGLMTMEVGVGLLFGFISRMVFYALDMAGAIITSEMGLQLPSSMNPMSGSEVTTPGLMLYYLAAMLWLSLDLHHWLLVALVKTYQWLPIGGAHLNAMGLADVLARTSQIFVIALQVAAPVMAVSFIVSLVFSVLGRAVPQMNVFQESFAVRILAGLSVFGLTLQLMSQHIINNLRRLPEDVLNVAQIFGAH
jgi:flagellar biosynthetic protein FliR